MLPRHSTSGPRGIIERTSKNNNIISSPFGAADGEGKSKASFANEAKVIQLVYRSLAVKMFARQFEDSCIILMLVGTV